MNEGNREKPQHRVSFVMPAFNEEGNVRAAVRRAAEALEKFAADYEIVFVDDGSSDATGAILDSLAAETPALRVIHHGVNKGYGAALRSGFLAARFPLVFYTDADNQFDPMEIGKFLPHAADFHVVAGRRVRRADPLIRLVCSKTFNLAVGLLFRVGVGDVNCAFKLFRREVFDALAIESDDFFVDAEILAKARALGFSIKEIPVSHFPRTSGAPTVGAGDVPRTLRAIFRIRRSLKTLSSRTGAEDGRTNRSRERG
ncbi:MAG: glycosyltransferase family 2 protein [bacterium]